MKKLTFITLTLLILLTGCSKADNTKAAVDTGEIILHEKDRSQLSLETEQIVEDTDDGISFSAGKEESVTIDDTTTVKTSDTTKSTVSTTKTPVTDTVKSETTKNTDKPKDTKVPENTTKAVETTVPKETDPPVTTQRPKETAPPETTKPAETTTSVETEPPIPKSAYDIPFDIEQIRSELISYGQSLGFRHRTSYKDGTVVTPDNSSWEMPIVASSSFNGEALKRSLYDYVSSYVGYEIYGGDPVTDFTIYIRPISNGYEIYFLH